MIVKRLTINSSENNFNKVYFIKIDTSCFLRYNQCNPFVEKNSHQSYKIVGFSTYIRHVSEKQL